MPKSFPSNCPAPSQTAESVLISVPGEEVLETQEPPAPAVLGPPAPTSAVSARLLEWHGALNS